MLILFGYLEVYESTIFLVEAVEQSSSINTLKKKSVSYINILSIVREIYFSWLYVAKSTVNNGVFITDSFSFMLIPHYTYQAQMLQ